MVRGRARMRYRLCSLAMLLVGAQVSSVKAADIAVPQGRPPPRRRRGSALGRLDRHAWRRRPRRSRDTWDRMGGDLRRCRISTCAARDPRRGSILPVTEPGLRCSTMAWSPSARWSSLIWQRRRSEPVPQWARQRGIHGPSWRLRRLLDGALGAHARRRAPGFRGRQWGDGKLRGGRRGSALSCLDPLRRSSVRGWSPADAEKPVF